MPDLRAAADRGPEWGWIDLTGQICPGQTCAPVVGDALLYTDSHHMSATFARTLAPQLGAEIERLLG